MKRLLSLILVGAIVILCVSCGKNNIGETDTFSTDANTSTETLSETETTTKNDTTDESAPSPEPMGNSTKKLKAIYGKRTGTDKTYTGLEPLEPITLPVVDPQNVRGLSESEIQHSFGVSENGVPHEISVNNQKFYDDFGALALDTTGEKVIYLTFDCGYENGCTEKILDTLKEKKVPAAFFVTLPHIKSCPELIARMINEGHTVGNHSVNHPNFSTISRTAMAQELEGLDNYLRAEFGYSSPFFRFPEGACSESALDLVQNAGFKSVFWSSAYADWDISSQKGADYAFETVTSRLHPGCVLLLHAVSPDNAEALGDIIDYAKEQGYVFNSL
ncbi:MAG: polysaccharide deacetylase family protein [Clostridia bacterium]|nr:polysaccharide deacetylase family protein [Clostridia bacterium]